MPDPRIQQAARLLIHYSTSIRPRDHVAIFASPEAEPLVAEVFREVLRGWLSVRPHGPGHASGARRFR